MIRYSLLVAVILAGCNGGGVLHSRSGVRANTAFHRAGGHVPATSVGIPGVGNFAQISPALYRGEQPTSAGFVELKMRHVKTIVNLRTLHGDTALLKKACVSDLQYVHIRAKPWHPEDEDVVAFLKIVEDPANQPVFVHCQHGADRTGYMVAAYRMVEQGWSADEAIDEMYRFNFHPDWTMIPAYLRQFDPVAIRKRVAVTAEPDTRPAE